MLSAIDQQWMRHALELAKRGIYTTHPNPNVGAVLVKEGVVIGEGWHQKAGEPHAEVFALREAGENARGATAYVTLEPCSHYGRTPPCAEALIKAGVARVVIAMSDPNPLVAGRGIAMLREAGIEVEVGLCGEEAEALNRGFLKKMRQGLPWVTVKLGASLDGRTAMASGESQWITSPEARQDVQRLRAQHGAVLSSSTTVIADDAALTLRQEQFSQELMQNYPLDKWRAPTRIVLDRQQQLTPELRLFAQGDPLWLVHNQPATDLYGAQRELIVPLNAQGQFDLPELLRQIAAAGINSVLIEAGATLCGALLAADLVDEVVLYLAPKLLGDAGRGMFHLPQLSRLADAPELKWSSVAQIGRDLRLTALPKAKGAN